MNSLSDNNLSHSYQSICGTPLPLPLCHDNQSDVGTEFKKEPRCMLGRKAGHNWWKIEPNFRSKVTLH